MKMALFLTVCILAGISLAGCADNENELGGTNNTIINEVGGTNNTMKNDNIKITAVNAKELQAPVYGERNLAAQRAATGANDFAFRLSAELAKNIEDESFVCSPYSVWLPLAALVNATDSQHKEKLLAAIGASGISEDDINSAASRMLYDLTKEREREFKEEFKEEFNDEYYEHYHNPLKIANAIFVGNNVTLRKEFAQTFMDFYRGASINVDFASSDAVDAVNKWASENTEGLITNLIQEFDPMTVAAIANAIYFSDRWQWEFNPEYTSEGVFHAPNRDLTAFYMLREGDDQTYYEDDIVQAMPLRFKSGGGLYIILPKSGDAAGLLSTMTTDYFDEIQRDSVSATGKLLLPRFSIENNINLIDALTALGVPLFDDASAPLTGGLIEEDIPVWLSDALQKAIIEVDEKGTTAAAVTVIAAPTAYIPEPTEPFKMICDRPFVFVLYSHTYDGGYQVLFTGVVSNTE